MPLIKSGTREAVSSNIREMIKAGHPRRQAIAAALSTARRYGKQAGGAVDDDTDRSLEQAYDPQAKTLRLTVRPPSLATPTATPKPGQAVAPPVTPEDVSRQTADVSRGLISSMIPQSIQGPTQEGWQEYQRKMAAVPPDYEGKIPESPLNEAPAESVAKGAMEGLGMFGIPGGEGAIVKGAMAAKGLGSKILASMAGVGARDALKGMDWDLFETELKQLLSPMGSHGPMKAMEQHKGNWIDSSNFEKISNAKGSNPGGTYRDPETGEQWYIKQPQSVDHLKNEMLANKLYQLAGVPVPDLRHTTMQVGDQYYPALASRMVKGSLLKNFPPGDYGDMLHLKENFPIDAWLANWDAVGTGKDNVVVNPITMEATRIDAGGALNYRAQGAPKGKDFGHDVPELKTMLDPKKSYDAAEVFQGAHKLDVASEGADRLSTIQPSKIAQLVNEWGPGSLNDKEVLYNKLMNRRAEILSHYDSQLPGQAKGEQIYKSAQKGQFAQPESSPNIHPQKDEDGNVVKIKNPSQPTPVENWSNPGVSAVVVPKQSTPTGLHGVPFKSWTPPHDWVGVSGTNEELYEPPWKSIPGKTNGSGVVIMEPDGRAWIAKPTNQYGGYEMTFPKGKLDPELNMQENAIKEAFEETGLKVKILGHIGDFERTTSKARYYLAVREGGTPSDMGWESQAVMLAPRIDANGNLLPMSSVDKVIFKSAKGQYNKLLSEGAVSAGLSPPPSIITADSISKELSTYGNDPELITAKLWELAQQGYTDAAKQAKFALPSAVKKQVNKTLWALKNKLPNAADKEQLQYLFADKKFPEPPKVIPEEDNAFKKAFKDYDKEIEEYYQDLNKQDDHQYELAQGPDFAAQGSGKIKFSELSEDQVRSRYKSMAKPVDWKNYTPPGVKTYVQPKLTKANPVDISKLGFNIKTQLYKGGAQGYHGEIFDPVKSKSYEQALFLADSKHVAESYGYPEPYVARAPKAVEIDWHNFKGSGYQEFGGEKMPNNGYSGHVMDSLIRQARKDHVDLLIIHNISDIGGNQTQYAFLNTAGTLRSIHAKFDPKFLHLGHSHWGLMGGGLLTYGALQGEEEQPMKKFASGGSTPFHERAYNEAIGAPTGIAEPGVRHFATPHIGMIHSPVPGRTDKLSMNVKGGSYILPASVVSGIGQGNSQAGASILNSFFKQGPYGASAGRIGAPKVNFGKTMSMRMPTMKMPKFSEGGLEGEAHNKVPIVAAGGEYVVHPDVVKRLGGGDMKKGHEILDNFVNHMRRKTIQDMRKEKPPKK